MPDATLLYRKVADALAEAIDSGVLAAGERVPSVREATRLHQVSVTTVLRAYAWLESQGRIEGHPRSGYYVRRAAAASITARSPAPLAGAEVDVSQLVLENLRSIHSQSMVPLGSPYPDPEHFPSAQLAREVIAQSRNAAPSSVLEDLPPGDPLLRRQIARRLLLNGIRADPDDIIVTNGATEAINLCLQAVAAPGATVAVESPTYYAMLLAIERLGMRAIEVPAHPETGIDLDALQASIEQESVAACILMPNFQNPLGFVMPEARRRRLVNLARTHQMPVIENGVYDELHYGALPPGSLKQYDESGLVLYCSSFSKSLAPGYRVGWAVPGRYRAQVERLKFLNTLATPSVPQRAIASYLQQRDFDRQLRRIRAELMLRRELMSARVRHVFPAETRISHPDGGYVLWVELPPDVDAMVLHRRALEHGITVAPGRIFSTTDRYRNFVRLNYSAAFTREVEQALSTLARLIGEQTRRRFRAGPG